VGFQLIRVEEFRAYQGLTLDACGRMSPANAEQDQVPAERGARRSMV